MYHAVVCVRNKSYCRKMTKKEIKEEQKKQGHTISGNKEDFLTGLAGAINSCVPVSVNVFWNNDWIGCHGKVGVANTKRCASDGTTKWRLHNKATYRAQCTKKSKVWIPGNLQVHEIYRIICKNELHKKPDAISGRNRKRKLSPTRKGKVHKDLGRSKYLAVPMKIFWSTMGWTNTAIQWIGYMLCFQWHQQITWRMFVL